MGLNGCQWAYGVASNHEIHIVIKSDQFEVKCWVNDKSLMLVLAKNAHTRIINEEQAKECSMRKQRINTTILATKNKKNLTLQQQPDIGILWNTLRCRVSEQVTATFPLLVGSS
jgi:hypothetical protein